MESRYERESEDLYQANSMSSRDNLRAYSGNALLTTSTLARIVRRHFSPFKLALVFIWVILLYWGERYVFNNSIATCDWEHWEQWPSDSRPHRLILLADPQLVDPHTYPGRPWPLSSLTVAYTDKYMKRTYKTLQRDLDPDTIYFMGDLFDGGREWATPHGSFRASEDQWKSYGHSFWLSEYDRFGRIFFEKDQVSGGSRTQKSRKIIASLPGNHDLGFGNGIQLSVRNRFQTFFGVGDRVDIIGNHTFVGLDTVSLSAMDIPGSPKEIWLPPAEFLDNVNNITSDAIRRELYFQQDRDVKMKHSHSAAYVEDFERVTTIAKPEYESQHKLPAVLLTHVPFFREPGTPCGPQRERHPPTAPHLEHDEPNAIRVAGGYQYQNVLTKEVTKVIAEKVGNIGNVFSGDDHDYCEGVHHAYPSAGSGIREVTVKSMSWAMGVRKPGFQLVSLWNPIDDKGRSLRVADGSAGNPTVQTQMCLLPDQLGIFIKYAICGVLTILVLTIHAIGATRREKDTYGSSGQSPVLPTYEPAKPAYNQFQKRSRASSATAHSEGTGMLAPRSQNSRARSISPAPFVGYALPTVNPRVTGPLIDQAGYYGHGDTDDWGYSQDRKPMTRSRKPKGFAARCITNIGKNMLSVAGPIFVWYWWLMRTG